MKQIGYWAVGIGAGSHPERKPGDLFVSTLLYNTGATEIYTKQGYSLIPAYIKNADYHYVYSANK